MKQPNPNFEGFNVTFHVSEACNLRCKYCYLHQYRPKDLPLEYAQKFIDLILTDPDPANLLDTEDEWIMKKGLILDFIGGEPLLRTDLLDKILSYWMFKLALSEHPVYTNWRGSISTNGTLFHLPKVQRFMDKYREVLSVGVSIDGTPELHDRNRVTPNGSGSMRLIRKGWDWYRDWMACTPLSTKWTLNKESIPYLLEGVQYLYEELGISEIYANFIFEDMHLEPADLELLDRQLEQIVAYVLPRREGLYVSVLDRNLTKRGCMLDPNRGWCGSGAMPALDMNGRIYPCFRFTPQNGIPEELDYHVGDVWNGFDHKDRFVCVRSQTRNKISAPECHLCDVESSCAWCIASAYAETGTFYRQTYICDTHKAQTKWAKIYWDTLKERYRDRV